MLEVEVGVEGCQREQVVLNAVSNHSVELVRRHVQELPVLNDRCAALGRGRTHRAGEEPIQAREGARGLQRGGLSRGTTHRAGEPPTGPWNNLTSLSQHKSRHRIWRFRWL